MGTQGTGRKRSSKKEKSTAEEDALNLIAREAEARLAAKRAARAEAREIRMKELERQQKELSDDDERVSVGSRGSVRVEDRDYLEKGSRAASALTAATLTSVGGTSSRRGSGETAITIDAETSIREIKDALGEVEEKYRKAMVSNAQLDNEKNNLMYQVDTLKDSLMELEELLCESRRGYEDKVKEYEREKHSHALLQFQFTEMKETLKQSEELLNDIRQMRIKEEGFVREISDLQETVEWKDKKIGALERQKEYTDAIRIERDELREETVKLKDILKKHGIVLGPDLNINGDLVEAEVSESPGADPVTQPAADSQSPPTEGHSMLGNTEETPLRSSREEEAAPEMHPLMFDEGKLHHVSCVAPCTAAGVSTLETSGEEPATCLEENNIDTGEQNVVKGPLIEDLNVGVIDRSITEAKDIIICSSQLQEIVQSSDRNVPITKIPKGGDLGETEPKVQSVDSHRDDLIKQQVLKQEGGDSDLQSTESCPQQKTAQDVLTESSRDEGNPTVSNTEHQLEPEEAEEAENDEAEEMPGKCQPQGAAASGKKKKRKRRGKKKGTHEESQQKEASDPEKGKKEIHNESVAKNNGTPAEPELHVSASGTLSESRVDQELGDPNFPNESLTKAAVDPVTDEQDHQHKVETEPLATPEEEMIDNVTDKHSRGLNVETVKDVEAVPLAEPLSPNKTLNNCRKDERDKEQTVEPDREEELGSASPVPETNLSTSDLTDAAEGAERTDGSSTVIHNESRVVRSVEDQVGSVDAMQSECAAKNPENTLETSSNVLSNEDIAADPSEPTSHPESKEKASASRASPDVPTDGSSGSTPPAAQNLLRDAEALVEPDHLPTESGDCCDSASLTKSPDGLDSVKSLLQTARAAQAEQLGHVRSQDESSAKVSSETEKGHTIDTLQTPDSPREATEICSSSEQDQADPECGDQMSSNDPHSETQRSHKPGKDEPEDEDFSQPTLQDADNEDEGHSFDFDDMDVEAAVATSLLGNPSLEEVEEGVEVMPDESSNGSSTGEDGADEPAGGHRGDCRDTGPPDNSNSCEEASSQQAGRVELCKKQREILEEAHEHIPEEGEACVVAEDIDQVASLPVEEGLDATRHEDLPQRAQQGGSSKEPQQEGKEMKRTSKRGKGKGKEDCKMS